MRYFCMIAWAGRLQQRGAATPDEWNPSGVRYENEETVDRILTMMPTDRKVRSVEEIDSAVAASLGEAISRVLWVPEDLQEEARICVQAKRSIARA